MVRERQDSGTPPSAKNSGVDAPQRPLSSHWNRKENGDCTAPLELPYSFWLLHEMGTARVSLTMRQARTRRAWNWQTVPKYPYCLIEKEVGCSLPRPFPLFLLNITGPSQSSRLFEVI